MNQISLVIFQIGETLSLPGCKTLVTCVADGNGWSEIKLIEIPGCSARQSCQMVNGSYECIGKMDF